MPRKKKTIDDIALPPAPGGYAVGVANSEAGADWPEAVNRRIADAKRPKADRAEELLRAKDADKSPRQDTFVTPPVGSVVRLNSWSPPMTVLQHLDSGELECGWFPDASDGLRTTRLHPACLTLEKSE